MTAIEGHIGRLDVVEFPQERYLSPQHLAACAVVPFRDDIIEHMPRGGRIAELGVQTGEFSQFILETCAPTGLHRIDVDLAKWSVADKFVSQIA